MSHPTSLPAFSFLVWDRPPLEASQLTTSLSSAMVMFQQSSIMRKMLPHSPSKLDDPRALNMVLYIRPSHNIYSHNELVSLWEKKTGKTFDRVYVSEEEILKEIQEAPVSLNLFLWIHHTTCERRPNRFGDRSVIWSGGHTALPGG